MPASKKYATSQVLMGGSFRELDARDDFSFFRHPCSEGFGVWRRAAFYLPHRTNEAIREHDISRRASVRRTTGLRGAGPCGDGLTHIAEEILPGGAVPFQSVGRDHFQA